MMVGDALTQRGVGCNFGGNVVEKRSGIVPNDGTTSGRGVKKERRKGVVGGGVGRVFVVH